MKRIYNAAAAARSALFCQSRTGAAARHLDPVVRDALAETVQEDAVLAEEQLREIATELEQAVQILKEFETKEQFLGVRTRQYRKALDQQAYELKQEAAAAKLQQEAEGCENEERDEEAALDYEARAEKWEKDTDALEAIVKTHTQILAQCEQMRRNIKELEAKKKKIQKMNEECQDFLQEAGRQQTAAAAADAHENNGDENYTIEECRPEESLESAAREATPEPSQHDLDDDLTPPEKDKQEDGNALSSTLETVQPNKVSGDESLQTDHSVEAKEGPLAQQETEQKASVEQAEELK